MNKRETRKQAEMDFELRFFESILKRTPDFIEALIAVGDLYTKKGFYEKGLDVDRKLVQLRPDDPIILYNLACSFSLVNRLDEALWTIKSAVACGYSDLNYLERDGDLQNLRQDARFKQFLTAVREFKIQSSERQK